MDRLQNVLSGLSIGLIVLVLLSVRRSHIRVEYSVSWLGAALTLLVISRSNLILDDLGALIGIADQPLVLLVLVFIVFLGVFYRFSIIISDLKDANIALTQKVAILEYRIQSQAGKDEKTEAAGA